MAEVLVTVGMNRWPFDRLISAIAPLCADHRVFVQTGTSAIRPPCPHEAFLPFKALTERMAAADVVITHAGNTVRLVQRLGKVPIAVAREAARGEMGNDHQVEYLRREERTGRVEAVWDVARLPGAVREHAATQARLLTRPLPQAPNGTEVADRLDLICADLVPANPFHDHPLRRYAYAWERLSSRAGLHLDVGCGSGEFVAALAATAALDCIGVDPSEESLRQFLGRGATTPVARISTRGPLPFHDGAFSSASLLDVLEHVPDEEHMLNEVRRVLAPDGLLVLTVPARHVFSLLDPDNAKFRLPRLHRRIYVSRFGEATYQRRFVDLSNGLRGDMSVGKDRHTNYRADVLVALLDRVGFVVVDVGGANLFWRWLHGPSLLAGPRLRRALDRAILADGRRFKMANLFLTARRRTRP